MNLQVEGHTVCLVGILESHDKAVDHGFITLFLHHYLVFDMQDLTLGGSVENPWECTERELPHFIKLFTFLMSSVKAFLPLEVMAFQLDLLVNSIIIEVSWRKLFTLLSLRICLVVHIQHLYTVLNAVRFEVLTEYFDGHHILYLANVIFEYLVG